jgi:hypothetical protein
MKLEDCTKDELIHFIRSECFYRLDNLEFNVLMCRSQKYEQQRSEESKIAIDALGEYIDLLKPYQGKQINDVPMEVLKKASNAQNRYEKHTAISESYQKQYNKIQKQIDCHLDDRRKPEESNES